MNQPRIDSFFQKRAKLSSSDDTQLNLLPSTSSGIDTLKPSEQSQSIPVLQGALSSDLDTQINKIEHSIDGRVILKIDDDFVRIHDSTKKHYQVYYGEHSIPKIGEEMVLKDYIGYDGKMWYCKYHKAEKCPKLRQKLKSPYKSTIVHHVSGYLFTYRCSICTYKCNILTNLSKHMNRNHKDDMEE